MLFPIPCADGSCAILMALCSASSPTQLSCFTELFLEAELDVSTRCRKLSSENNEVSATGIRRCHCARVHFHPSRLVYTWMEKLFGEKRMSDVVERKTSSKDSYYRVTVLLILASCHAIAVAGIVEWPPGTVPSGLM